MSTYACWRLWVGARFGNIDLTEAPTSTHEILDKLYDGEPYYMDDMPVKHIYMNGKTVGIGVEVQELNWGTEIGSDNVFDVKKVAEAQRVLPRLQKAFGDLGLRAQILIIHHIDLGG